MSQKKKHKKPPQNLKLIAASLRKEYFGRLKEYTDQWFGEGTFGMIPESEYDFIFLRRYTTPRLEIDPSLKVDKKIVEKMRSDLNKLLHGFQIKIIADSTKISLLQYMVYFRTINGYFRNIRTNEYERFKDLIRRQDYFHEKEDDLNEKTLYMLEHIGTMLGVFTSYPQKKYYWIGMDFHDDLIHNTGRYYLLKLRDSNSHSCNLTVDGMKRPCYKLGIPLRDFGMRWCRIKIQSLSIGRLSKIYPIFIQSHVMTRMFERLDVLDNDEILYNFYASFIKPVVTMERGKILIPYLLFGKTIGYFLGEIVEGRLLLLTFLFITNEGTPEARKIKETAGLTKMDVKYWNMDKLRNFIESDIADNPALKKIFADAGCGDLFNLTLTVTKYENGKIKIAGDMLKYLGLNEYETARHENNDESVMPFSKDEH